jgi:hypothetical protein
VDQLLQAVLPNHRHVEEGPGGGPHRLGVVDVHRGGREDHRLGPGGVGGSEDRPGVPGIPHLHQDRDEPALDDAREGHIHELRDGDDALGRHGRGEVPHDLNGDRPDRNGGLHRRPGDLVQGFTRERREDLLHGCARFQRLDHSLDTLEEESAIAFAHGPLLEPNGPDHPCVLCGGDHS